MSDMKFCRILGTGILWPNTTPSFTAHPVDASNEGVAVGFEAKSTEAITHVGIRYGSRTGADTSLTYVAGIEGFTASTGAPDGAYKASGNAFGTFAPPGDSSFDGLFKWIALGTSYTPTLGEQLVATVRYSSGTISGANFNSFTNRIAGVGGVPGCPYPVINTGGSWSLAGTMPVYGIRTANLRYGSIIQSVYSTRTASTVGHRLAMKVNLPSAAGSTYQVAGIRFVGSLASAANKAPLCKIWSASAALTSRTLDSEFGTTLTGANRIIEVLFSDLQTLNFGTDYYFGLEVADATNGGVQIYGSQQAEAADNASDEGGSYVNLATYNGSVWTDDATIRPWMELIVADWTEPSGGGGGIIMPARSRVFSPMGNY